MATPNKTNEGITTQRNYNFLELILKKGTATTADSQEFYDNDPDAWESLSACRNNFSNLKTRGFVDRKGSASKAVYSVSDKGMKSIESGRAGIFRTQLSTGSIGKHPKKKRQAEPEPRLNLSEHAQALIDNISSHAMRNSELRDAMTHVGLLIKKHIDVEAPRKAPTKPKKEGDSMSQGLSQLNYENENLEYSLYKLYQGSLLD